jgi:type I restriction enzyme S subunit
MTDTRIGDVLQLERIPVEIDETTTYSQIGIRSFGNGIFHRDPCLGSELSKLKYFEVHPGRLVVSNIMAWEGAIAVSTDAEKGLVGSARFLSYRPIGDVDLRYLNYYFQSLAGVSLIRSISTGTVTRNQTVSPKNFERAKIPLPRLADQRRIADKLDSALMKQREIKDRVSARDTLVNHALDAEESAIIADCLERGWQTNPLSSVAEVNPRTVRPDDEIRVAFVPMAAVSGKRGVIDSPDYKLAGEVRAGYKLFRRGDVIFARITPCMQNGKSAIFEDPSVMYGFGSTEFHVLRPHDASDTEWIHRVVRSRGFIESAIPFMSGTAGQQRVSADYLRKVNIPIPPSAVERARVVQEMDDIQTRRERFRELNMKQGADAKALRSSLLDAAFGGRL